MKRKAFILTEILTSMALQALFAITLCGAFYMLLTFSTSTQQVIAAHDDGDVVISYIDSRIRNAGLGLWGSASHKKDSDVTGVGEVFHAASNFGILNTYGSPMPDHERRTTDILPVAIVSNINNTAKVSVNDGVYEGNVLTLLYAHKDDKNDKLVLRGFYDESPDEKVRIDADTNFDLDESRKFKFIEITDLSKVPNKESDFDYSNSNSGNNYANIKSWAVMEASGLPVRLYKESVPSEWTVYINAPYYGVYIYPMSELLNLECERIYTDMSTEEHSLMVRTLETDDWSEALPRAKNILELHMTLDTKKPIPVFTLEVLVREGNNSARNTKCPDDWPSDYWKPEFASYNVHISRASWKLYNLAPLFH